MTKKAWKPKEYFYPSFIIAFTHTWTHTHTHTHTTVSSSRSVRSARFCYQQSGWDVSQVLNNPHCPRALAEKALWWAGPGPQTATDCRWQHDLEAPWGTFCRPAIERRRVCGRPPLPQPGARLFATRPGHRTYWSRDRWHSLSYRFTHATPPSSPQAPLLAGKRGGRGEEGTRKKKEKRRNVKKMWDVGRSGAKENWF